MAQQFDDAYLQSLLLNPINNFGLSPGQIFDKFSLTTGTVEFSDFTIRDIIINGGVEIRNYSFSQIIFENVTFKCNGKPIKIINCNLDKLQFDKCKIESVDNFLFLGINQELKSSINSHLIFLNSSIPVVDIQSTRNLSINLYGSSIDTDLKISDCDKISLLVTNYSDTNYNTIPRIKIRSSAVNRINIYGKGKIGTLSMLSCSAARIDLNQTVLEELVIDAESTAGIIKKIMQINLLNLNNSYITRSSISKVIIRELVLYNCYFSKDISFRIYDADIDVFSFNYFINNGQVNLIDVKVSDKGTLHIQNSDLGKAVLLNCNIGQCRFKFSSSKITDLFVSGTDMPTQIIGDYDDERLVYSQIKKIYDNRGDAINSLKFYSLEMNSYKKSLYFKGNIPEILNLWLDYASTNYGESWIRGLISTLIVSGLFYFLFCLVLGYKLDISTNGLKGLLKLFSYFFDFINPVHKTEDILNALASKSLGSKVLNKSQIAYSSSIYFAKIIDNIGRIFITYCIYQLVQAFRRLGKK